MADTMPEQYTVMTDAGVALAAQLLNSTNEIKAFRAEASDEVHYTDSEDTIAGLTELGSVKQEGIIQALVPDQQNKSSIQIDFHQDQIDADYTLSAVGLYATDKNGTEVLYAVECLKHPQYMAKDSNSSVNTQLLHIVVGNIQNVSLTISPAGTVSNAKLQSTLADYVKTDSLKKLLPQTLADTVKDNVFTKNNKYLQDPTDVNGNAYVTGAGAVAAAQGHFAKTSESGGVTVGGVELGVDDAGKLKYGDDLVLLANEPQAPGFSAEMDFSVGQPEWTVTLPKIDGGASIVSSTVQYRKDGDTDWTSIQSAVTTLSGHVSGLAGNSEYEFRAFVTNYAGDSPYSDVATIKTMDDRIFGASWDMSSDPKLTRTDAAVGLVAGINGAQNDFDTVGPWAKMDKTITDDKGNSFVRIPKLYIKKTQTDKLATWQVSLSKIDDTWYLPKCFWDFTNNKELDYVDVGRYQGTVASGLLQSKSRVTATNSLTIGSFRTDAKANGDGYQLLDIHVVDVWQVLFLIEFATLNSQSIMNGNLSGRAELNNGTGSSHAGSSGFATNTGNMDYRGIENMYGNLYQWVDGVNLTGANAWVCDDANKYQSDLFAAPYQALSYTTDTGWISKMGYDSSHPFAQFATVGSGSASTYYADYQYTTSGNNVAAYGDCWNGSGGYGGAFYWYLSSSSTGSVTDHGSRLVKKALG